MALYSRWRCNQEWRSIGADTVCLKDILSLTLQWIRIGPEIGLGLGHRTWHNIRTYLQV